MELGNMVFGNSRGNFLMKRGVGYENEFQRLTDKLEMDSYVEEFENDTFALFPYYWGECTCGFDNYDFEEEHLDTCYQAELLREKISAGARYSSYWEWYEFPESWSWNKKRKVEDKIYKKLTKKYNLPMQGCAVHCTCDYEQRYEAWLKTIGYPEGHHSDCLLVKPNFHYKPTDFQIQWYKYPFRDSYTNHKITLRDFINIIDECLVSLNGDRTFQKRIRGIRRQQTISDKRLKAWDAEGYLCHRCMHGLPLKNKKVICAMTERNWQDNGNVGILMIPDGTEIDWQKECKYFLPWKEE